MNNKLTRQFHTSSILFNGDLIVEDNFSSFIERLLSSSISEQIELGRFLQEWLSPSLFINVKTSGSTGTPKQIQLSKASMTRSALNTIEHFNLNQGSTICLTLPLAFIAGKMMVIRALVGKLNLLQLPNKSNPFKERHEKFDFIALVPNQIEAFLDHSAKYHFKSKVLVGGGIISEALMDKIKLSKQAFHQSYAMTETASHVAIRTLSTITNNTPYTALEGNSFSTDERGCLVINSNYLDQPYYVTNDMVSLVSSKQFYWNGRIDNVINSAGIKLNPELIEHKLESIFTTRFYVGKVDDTILGHKIVLVIEGKEAQFDLRNLNTRMKKILAKYEVPRQLLFVEKFKETPNGKILREY